MGFECGTQDVLKVANFLRMTSDYDLAEETTSFIHVANASECPSEGFLRKCLSENKPILIRGHRDPESWRDGVSKEKLAKFGVSGQRLVKAFGALWLDLPAFVI